jgi:hypothetical protein
MPLGEFGRVGIGPALASPALPCRSFERQQKKGFLGPKTTEEAFA